MAAHLHARRAEVAWESLARREYNAGIDKYLQAGGGNRLTAHRGKGALRRAAW